MTKPALGASAPARTTVSIKFFSANPEGQPLFAVNAGVPAADALNIAALFLSSAEELLGLALDRDASQGVSPQRFDAAWSAVYLVQFARAVVESIPAVAQETRHD